MSKKYQRRMDKVIQLLNEITRDARFEFGEGTHLYFESAGSLHLMRAEPEDHKHRDVYAGERQKLIIVSSSVSTRETDCGAW